MKGYKQKTNPQNCNTMVSHTIQCHTYYTMLLSLYTFYTLPSNVSTSVCCGYITTALQPLTKSLTVIRNIISNLSLLQINNLILVKKNKLKKKETCVDEE